MEIIYKKIDDIKEYNNNPRNNDKAVDKVAESIKQFGFKQPIVIDSEGEIIAGHTRFKASKKLNYNEVPCLIADDLTDEQIKAYRLADNKTNEFAEWDISKLSDELKELENEFTGFDENEIKSILANIDDNKEINDTSQNSTSNFITIKIDNYSFKVEDINKFSIFEEVEEMEDKEKSKVNQIILKHLYNAIDEI